MRIAFVTNNYTPYSGGVVRSIDTIGSQLQRNGHELCIIAPQFYAQHDDPAWVKRIPASIRFSYKHLFVSVPLRVRTHLYEYLDQCKPDVVHVHHPFFLGPIAASWARSRSVPVLFTYHTIYQDYAHYVPMPGFLTKPIITHMVNKFCMQVDRIIVPSYGMQAELAKHAIEHTTVLASPIRDQFFTGSSSFRPQPITQLICVTRFTKEKNVSFLFDLLALLPASYRLTIIGYGEQEGMLRAQAQPFGDRVQFSIQPSLERMLEAYRKAHFFIFPSQTDTQGLVLAESMAMGVPVFALDGVGQRDIIENAHNGFIADDAAQMARMIEKTSRHMDHYEQLAAGARRTASRYQSARLVAALEQLYATLLH